MADIFIGNIKGPQGNTGPQGNQAARRMMRSLISLSRRGDPENRLQGLTTFCWMR